MPHSTEDEKQCVEYRRVRPRGAMGLVVGVSAVLGVMVACSVDGSAPATGTDSTIPGPNTAAECAALSPASRAGCPLLGPVFAVVEIPSGVRVSLESEAAAQLVLAQMRCRIASTRSNQVGTPPSCPLDLQVVSVLTADRPDTLEINGGDSRSIEAIREYAIREFVHTRQSNE